MEREVCPVCSEKGITEPREVTTKEMNSKTIKFYSPCGHKSVIATVEDNISLKDDVKVDKQVVVTDGIKIRDSWSVATSVLQGYEQLSGTFTVDQAIIAKTVNLEENIKQLVDLTKEQLTHSKTESKNRKKQWYITTAITLIAVLIAVTSLLKTLKII